MTRLLLFPAAFLITLMSAATAHADFSACNRTEWDIAVAVAIETPEAATSYGWWTISPGTCETVLETGDEAADIYAYARHHTAAGGWSGPHTFCIGKGRFEIKGRNQCMTRGYEPVGFFKIDMKPSQDLRYDFTDSVE